MFWLLLSISLLSVEFSIFVPNLSISCSLCAYMNACQVASFSCVQFCATLWTVACQAPLSMRFSRQEYWSGLPCPPPGDLLTRGSNLSLLCLLHWQAVSLQIAPPKFPLSFWCPAISLRSWSVDSILFILLVTFPESNDSWLLTTLEVFQPLYLKVTYFPFPFRNT